MYTITLSLRNPITGDSEVMTYQFDPATLTQAKWSAAFTAVQAKLTTLVSRATPLEPPTW